MKLQTLAYMTTAMFVVLALTTFVVSVVPSASAAQLPGCSGNPDNSAGESGNPHDDGESGNPDNAHVHHADCPGSH